MPCSCCEITDQAFGESEVRSGLRRYRKRGPAQQTREILRAVRARGVKDASLLDIGGGVGAIYHELLGTVADSATHVDASSAYLRAAQEEAERRGESPHVRFVHADFTDVASSLPPADVVTLDRVVCCYPDFQSLLDAAGAHARQLLAMSYPREVWYVRLAVYCINLFQSVRGDAFRAFVHPVASMDALLTAHGMRRVSLKRFAFWEVALYARP